MTKKPATTKGDGRAQAKRIVDLVQKEIDDGASSAEEIHKAIASLPLEVLERLDLFEDAVKGARKVQEASIGAMYDLIRKVNDEAARFAKEMLAGRSVPSRVAQRPARTPARKKAAHAHPA